MSRTLFRINTITITHIAHIFRDGSELKIQSLEEHANGVADLASQFTSTFGMGDWGRLLGLLHDKGKERADFQNYIRRENGIPAPPYGDKTHAWIGAKLAKTMLPACYPMLTFPLLGHHAGMCDYTKLKDYMGKEIPSEVNSDIVLSLPSMDFFNRNNLFNADRQKYIHHVERMLFSCLVDADYLDTERFMQPDRFGMRKVSTALSDLLPKLEDYLAGFKQDTPVNVIRKQIQDCCRSAAAKPTGVYSMTVPTGGGKTLSSLLWALLHAVKNGKRRIIIAIPYTSIISQTAAILKEIFGEDMVLEHHSNYDYHDNEDRYRDINPERMASENWDAPIIVTTNVQLFESMYASHPGRCRKLHNIVDSVIVLDEVQTLPGEHLQAIIDALKAYNELFGVSLLFTTASQPTLQGEIKGHEHNLFGFNKIEELIPKDMMLHDKLRRVELRFEDTSLSFEDIAAKMMQHERVLCIVNTRKAATELFRCLPESDFHYHLSRNMCTEHLDAELAAIKARLKADDHLPVRVVTTQLIEAGVDIDFPFVMRQEIGLDSILQAAGRCNREGKLPLGKTIVFKIDGVSVPRGTMAFANQARLNMHPHDDLFAPEAMTEYFIQYYNNIPSFDKKDKNLNNNNICSLLHNVHELCFDTAGQYFRLIDDSGYTVVVNYGEAASLVDKMRRGDTRQTLYRQLSRYSVNISKFVFETFAKEGLIEPIEALGKETGLYFISDPKQYNGKYGLMLSNHFQEDNLII